MPATTMIRALAILLAWAVVAPTWGEESAAPDAKPLEEVVVVATTPVPGATIDADKVPSNVQTLRSSDLAREGSPSLISTLNGQLGSININDNLADPFQPDILYRGFEASPVLGTPQGLAVYQNGVRINEAFGDAVNWDLIPDIAISQIDVVSANPVFGLNALGGAASISMKNGFNYQGTELELSGGSFNQRAGTAQIGVNNGALGFYAAGRSLNQDGWRLFAHDSVRQFFTAFSARSESGVLDLSYTHDDNQLFGPGAAPVQSLALDPKNVFTGPQANLNRLDFLTLNGSIITNASNSLQGVLYYRNYRQSVSNGDGSDFSACTSAVSAGLLCQNDGITRLVNDAGQPLPDITNDGALVLGQNDFESIHGMGFGASMQLSQTRPIGGHSNQLTTGVSLDSGHVDFMSGTELGIIDPALLVQPTGLLVDTPEGTGFPATPVILKTTNRYYGVFATDTLDLTPSVAVTASGRYNVAQVNLFDQRGANLNGNNRYTHFNPAIGATYKITSRITAYGGYSVTNRAPTASEIECSDPLLPCLLPANLAGDPPGLQQVIAHTYELGLRGKFPSPDGDAVSSWNLSAFRTSLENDIYAISTSISTGFFQNIGATRREGLDAGFNYRWSSGLAYLDYSYVDATFRSALMLNSPSSPAADQNGNIQVEPGDRLPLIPQHRIKAGADYNVLPRLTVGGSFILIGAQFYRGDESNQAPQLPGYHVLALHGTYHFGSQADLYISVQNVFDARYSTFGILSDPTGVGAPGIPVAAQANDPGVDNRFQNPAAPRSVFGGFRVRF